MSINSVSGYETPTIFISATALCLIGIAVIYSKANKMHPGRPELAIDDFNKKITQIFYEAPVKAIQDKFKECIKLP